MNTNKFDVEEGAELLLDKLLRTLLASAQVGLSSLEEVVVEDRVEEVERKTISQAQSVELVALQREKTREKEGEREEKKKKIER